MERLSDPDERAERAGRILAAARDLLLRHGYRRVTIDDVARHAGIGKGTVYLHWKTRQQLFRAVLDAQVQDAIRELIAELDARPDAWLPHGLARAYFLAILRRPVLTGFVVADADLLGKLVEPGSAAREQRHDLVSSEYFQRMAGNGLLRKGLTADAASYAFLAVFEGFLRAEVAGEPRSGARAEDRADLLADVVRGGFESGRRLPPAERRRLATEVIDLFTRLADADRDEK